MARTKRAASGGLLVALLVAIATFSRPDEKGFILLCIGVWLAAIYTFWDWVSGASAKVPRAIVLIVGAALATSAFGWFFHPVPALSELEIEQRKWLERYPLGYVMFDLNTATGGVAPREFGHGSRNFSYSFQKVRLLENTPTHIAVQLPDLYENNVLLLSGSQIGGDPRTMEAYGAGYAFGNNQTGGIMATGQILKYEGNDILWIVGFS